MRRCLGGKEIVERMLSARRLTSLLSRSSTTTTAEVNGFGNRQKETKTLLTRRWREPDSNHRSRSCERFLGCRRREMPDRYRSLCTGDWIICLDDRRHAAPNGRSARPGFGGWSTLQPETVAAAGIAWGGSPPARRTLASRRSAPRKGWDQNGPRQPCARARGCARGLPLTDRHRDFLQIPARALTQMAYPVLASGDYRRGRAVRRQRRRGCLRRSGWRRRRVPSALPRPVHFRARSRARWPRLAART